MSDRRLVVVLLAAVTILPLLGGGLATAQTNESTSPTETPTATPTQTPSPTPTTTPTATPTPTPTPTSTPTPDAPSGGNVDADGYDISELRRGGRQPAGAPDSVRYLMEDGDPVGAIAVRYEPAGPTQSEMQFLSPGTTLHTDDIQLYSTRFGRGVDPSDFTLHVVFWQKQTRQKENGTRRDVETVAAKQTERTYSVTMGTGYDTANVTFPNHFDQTWRATMWMSKDGEPLEGVRWTLNHQTVASAENRNIDDAGEQWLWALQNIFIIAVPGLLMSSVSVRRIIQKTGYGPDKGPMWWGMVVIALAIGLGSVAFFRTAQTVAHIPQLFGAAIVVIGFIAMLETYGREKRTDEFVRDELEDAKSPLGEGIKNALYRDKARVNTVRRDDGRSSLATGPNPRRSMTQNSGLTTRSGRGLTITRSSPTPIAMNHSSGPPLTGCSNPNYCTHRQRKPATALQGLSNA